MRFIHLFLSLLLAGSAATFLATFLAACASWSPPIERTMDHFAPYNLDIPQGNVLTQDMLTKLKPGMTPSQVRFVLGTPLVVDPFHKERWDYVYSLVKGGKLIEHRRVTVVFENDKLKAISGDVAATSAPQGEKK